MLLGAGDPLALAGLDQHDWQVLEAVAREAYELDERRRADFATLLANKLAHALARLMR